MVQKNKKIYIHLPVKEKQILTWTCKKEKQIFTRTCKKEKQTLTWTCKKEKTQTKVGEGERYKREECERETPTGIKVA